MKFESLEGKRSVINISIKKGPFWLKCGVEYKNNNVNYSFENAHIIAFPVPCTADGTPSHINVWNDNSIPWNYYPRGRVEVRHGKAIVFANPICYEYSGLEKDLRAEFNLNDIDIIFKVDNSSHYSCLINEGS